MVHLNSKVGWEGPPVVHQEHFFQFAMSKPKSTFCQPSEVVVVQMYIFFSKPKSTFCQHSEVVAVHSIHKDKDHHKHDRTNRTRTITKSSPRIKLFSLCVILK